MKSVSDRDVICHQALERVSAIDFDREKEQQKRSHRHIKEEAQVTRRSAFTVRLCLREYCIEVLRSAYNTLVRQVRRVLERNAGSSSHDDSYLLWAIRFFMEFNRLSGLQLQLVSESLSVQCFHWVLTRMQHDMDMIVSDKKQARLWAKRLHVALLTFRELLQSLLALQRLKDDNNARALFDMLLNNVCYVLEYRETVLHLLMNYNEAHSTKVFLRDVVETANVFIKMMERFCQDSVVVQDKRRGGGGGRKKKQPVAKSKPSTAPQPTEEELSSKWAELATEVCSLLSADLEMPEDEQPMPFDAASEKSIDDQREDCMIRINKLLRSEKLDQAVALLRAAREVWPENEVFGAISAAPEDELLLLREIFMYNITTAEAVEKENQSGDEKDEDDDLDNEEFEEQDNGLTEKTFKFDDIARRLLNPKIVRACTLVLSDWADIPTRSLKAAVTILHRIAYGCKCAGMLFQAKLFRIFQQVFSVERDVHQEELRRLAIFVVRKFVEVAPTNPKIYAELLFYKGIREANELESGYCDAYEAGTKGAWSEEQESELRFLFEENQRNPETDKDVIDWILDNLADKTRNRRTVLKKLKELGLLFKAPTKRSTKSAQGGKNLWQPEEDEELRSLYDQHRIEPDCLQRIVHEFADRRSKQQIIKRMLQIHLIADKSEILPAKTGKGRGKAKGKQAEIGGDGDGDGDEYDFVEEPMFEDEGYRKPNTKSRPKKAKKRQVVRTPLDVGTVRALIGQVNAEKYQSAIEWLQECIQDASEETEEPAEDDDGVPLLPLMQDQKDAMEDGDFQKVLVALGMQPPIAQMEAYWRIPTYLNAADLKVRSKILSGEEVDMEPEDQAAEDDEEVGSEEDEDFLEKHSRQRQENILAQQQQKLDSLMFNQSDDEAEQRAPPKSKAKPKAGEKKAKRKIKDKAKESKDSGDEGTYKTERQKPNTDDLFDHLRAKRATKIKLDDMVLNESTKAAQGADDDAFNFNSEDYRARLLELEDGDGDEDVDEEKQDEDGAANEDKENNTNKSVQRARRVNVIDSDSDNDDDGALPADDKTNKRPRSDDDRENEDEDEDKDSDEEANFLARKKPAKPVDGEPAKRRRLAIIDDDDEDDF
ncbi:protein timeless homolog isoform X2 [Drosophila gunungcola]|nr:protein timeless homolog isoform X2 [Drosophila gunungcola]